MFQTKVVEKTKNTHFVLSNIFSENHAFYALMWENMAIVGAGHTLQHSVAHAHCILDN